MEFFWFVQVLLKSAVMFYVFGNNNLIQLLSGRFNLCICRESGRESNISHYIIAKVASEDVKDGYKYQIGTQLFPDIPTLLYFYRSHYLESTPLIRPAPRNLEEYVAKFDFEPRVSHSFEI